MENISESTGESVAAQLLETVPLVMKVIRRHVTRHRPADLSLPQFRALAYLRCHAGASLCEVADFLGLSPSSTSKIIDGLLERALVSRQTDAIDRRRALLNLTPAGDTIYDTVCQSTRAYLDEVLIDLTPDARQTILTAIRILQETFRAYADHTGCHRDEKEHTR